ncbi:7091_t:CDS:2 [Acaulospora morrowiae]|uniref:7091_t:CDS:1 n=1 Tax=Acaulospora morrowiae TaxID=94023 RepID=A0A9N9A1T6_9GLOM|nr:7091_t:CDS:2 [Acaulospora morrowiae]
MENINENYYTEVIDALPYRLLAYMYKHNDASPITSSLTK